MNLHTVKWAQCDKTEPEKCKNCSSKCAYDCAQLQYTIQHRTVLIISPLTSNHLFIYLFPEFRMQQYKQQNSIHIKGQMCRHLHSTSKTKLHLVNTMLVHGIICRQVGDTKINHHNLDVVYL